MLRGGDADDATMSAQGTSTQSTAESTASSSTTQPAASSSQVSSTATSAASSSAKPAEKSEPANKGPAARADKPAANTMLLLDTSDGLAPYFDPVTQALAETATTLGEEDSAVALWNYSSPISASATVGYRQNVGYGDAASAAFAVQQFGTGGVPQTRSAVVAAMANASEQAATAGPDARVLLVTTGTEQDMDDASFQDALNQARADNVSLSVVHLGAAPADAPIKDAASVYLTVKDPSNSAEVSKAIKAAAGVA
ncbi:VWA domain-containing protein [Corynebacterium sp.]|uniref:VWA domain-containing protein n=1 Tax=Corynebacterium sp. TaxID=1720 RepID=UPI0026DD04B6|nr:VWA domain-containing protein [Corynebacterium sp.]